MRDEGNRTVETVAKVIAVLAVLAALSQCDRTPTDAELHASDEAQARYGR